MDTDRLTKRLMATFLGELEDHLRTLERDLLALEKQPESVRGELFTTLFRAAHSLKGAARSVGVAVLENAGHRLEESFAAGRDGRVPVDAAWFERVLPVVDEIRANGRRLRAQVDGDAPANGPHRREAAPSVVPALEETAVVPAEANAGPAASVEATAPSQTAPWSGVVRVAAAKLDSLLAQSGELLVVRHRASERVAAARALHDATAGWQREWRRIEHQFTSLLQEAAGDTDDRVATGELQDAPSPRRQAEQLLAPHKASLVRFVRDLQRLTTELGGDCRALEQTAQRIEAEVHRARMLPFAEACEGLDRMVRDIATSAGKKAEIAIVGGDIEIDRSVLDSLKDPLLHLVRNAVDHGIEPASSRRAAGKPETGRITVAAAIRGARVVITVGDDGSGLDLAAVGEKLRRMGLPVPPDEQELAERIFSHGFSTSSRVTALSGRGVGLEVVKSQVTAMRGTVRVSFEPGRGTNFALRVPLTLTSLRALIVEAGRRMFAIDTASVDRVLRVGAADIRSIEGREVIMLGGRPVAIVTLAQVLGISDRAVSAEGRKRPAVVLAEGGRMAAFVLDHVHAEREIVVRPLGRRLRRIRHLIGPTILPDGSIALILNTPDLLDGMRGLSSSAVAQSMTVQKLAASPRLLLVDDSVTTRTLEKTILESAGYEVLVATDGAEAWQLLLDRGADLVVSDVEMPRMDGFSLTEAIRSSKQFRELPVILMTARDNDADKAHGLKAGANAYLFKSAFDQRELLATIAQIL